MELELRHGTALLDDDDWELASAWVWWSARSQVRHAQGRLQSTAYVLGRPKRTQGTGFPLHRFVLGLPSRRERSVDVDHINGNGLDNRKVNLRLSSRAQNLANTRGQSGTSPFKGVSYCKKTGRWKAQITVKGVNRNLGRFLTQEEAAVAYNVAAVEAWGEFAFQNILDVA